MRFCHISYKLTWFSGEIDCHNLLLLNTASKNVAGGHQSATYFEKMLILVEGFYDQKVSCREKKISA